MADSGSESRSTVLGQLAAVLRDHWELLALEVGFESQRAARRVCAWLAALLFGALSAVIAQVALIYGLMRVGLSAAAACLIVSAVYAVMALLIYFLWGRRDPRLGPPLNGTRREVSRSLEWIQKLFS